MHSAQTVHENNKMAVGTISPHVPKSQWGKLIAFSMFTHIANCSPVLPKPTTRGWTSTVGNEVAQILGRASEKRAGLRAARGDVGVYKEAGQEPYQCPLAEDG